MRRSIKYTLIGLVIVALAGAAPLAVEPIVVKIGENSIRQLARDGNFCTTPDCEEGMNYVIGFLETNYGLSPENVKWCMGVDVIAHYELPFGNDMKNALTDQMYQRCGDPRQDEPARNYTTE
ncbi:hypothetical protein KUG47_14065 [Falsochrobactrum sp. TDYN1]|uniref:Rap1a immunity protein domain-containing protein n=1 Tax=Falsochrobactrum tianjinense TaxID=2706015 RepID=A0A949PNH8_9HYPH|nr:hypothetical protein [Falsochrobactrum sp. TDYN1]MBV2144621.1 hypothetical protein [Falsochrobactrum sp. TDYN1]